MMHKVPLYDLSLTDGQYSEIIRAMDKIRRSGQYILGDEVAEFENRWAQHTGYGYAVGIGSGTCALEAAIRSLDVGVFKRRSSIERTRFIVPANTYSATAMAVCNAGYVPVFVDCNERYGMDTEKLKTVLENDEFNSIAGIIPVHLYGHIEAMYRIMQIAHSYDIPVIEDAAQAHGNKQFATGNDRMYSFFPTKNLGAFGDAGCVVTNSEERAKWIEKWRNQGRVTGNTVNHEIIGTNSRLDTLQAAVLNVKLNYLEDWNKSREASARVYFEELKDVPDLILPPESGLFHFFVIRITGGKRDDVMKKLRDAGIGCSVHYPFPLHLQGAYRHLGYKAGDFPVAEKLTGEVLSIPMHPHLKREDIACVCENIRRVVV